MAESSTFTVRLVAEISIEFDPANYDGGDREAAMRYEEEFALDNPEDFIGLVCESSDGNVTVEAFPDLGSGDAGWT